MKKKITLALIIHLFLISSALIGQEKSEPISKDEMIRLLTAASERQITQGEITSQIERRGISFPVDEKTLGELRQAGARSFLLSVIRRAGEEALTPRLKRPSESGEVEPDKGQESSDNPLEELPFLEQARHHALEYVRELPNFIVTQKITRYAQSPRVRDWKLEDKLEVELTYREGEGETFKVLKINGKPSNKSYEDIGGSTSTGEFGSLMVSVFEPQYKASFKEAAREQFNGRSAIVYEFKVLTRHSHNKITDRNSKRTIVSGYTGKMWIDTETKRVLRIEQAHDDIPPNFPISAVENVVEYDWVAIGEERYLLPVHAELLLGWDWRRTYTRNVIEFKNYHKFETSLKIVPDKDPHR